MTLNPSQYMAEKLDIVSAEASELRRTLEGTQGALARATLELSRLTREREEAVRLLRDMDGYLGSLRMLKAVTGPSIEARHRNVCAFLARIDGAEGGGR